MSKEDLSTHCKQRFKGIESFLRRVAFNLGNTPSQTEVKIISCIPIDVTDLQEKILSLEKQLNEATACRSQAVAGNNTSCATALYTTTYPGVSNHGVTCNELDCDRGTSPLVGPSSITLRSYSTKQSAGSLITVPSTCYCNCKPTLQHTPNDSQSQPFIICEPQKEKRRNFFKKKKKLPKKKNTNMQFVYYAQTSAPFRDTDQWNVLDEMETNTSDGMTKSYLADMVRRQYRSKMLGCDISNISEYSSPVCRDSAQGCRLCPYESDVCSCCRGQFHNIDHQRNKEPAYNPTYLHETTSGSSYYDSSLYDLVPVKEKPVKIKNNIEMPAKKENKPQVDGKCWSEERRARIPHFRPFIVNYHTISPTRNNYVKSISRNMKERDTVIKKMAVKQKRAVNFGQQIDMITSKSCCVEFGNVYAKKMRNKANSAIILNVPQPHIKNAECSTNAINNTECKTVTGNADLKKTDGKTEATLNQIKSILQSVLTEVKTNNQIKNTSEDKPKRDAVVQKGVSQSNLQGSSFLSSFTYSPYNMNPYIASQSQKINSTQFCYPQTTMKYLQNFPLIIQSGRQMCNRCYRENSNIKPYSKHATTTSTNTNEIKEQRNKETDILIKEIYKSMALNAGLPTKDASYSEYENLKSNHDCGNKTIEEPKERSDEEIPKKVVRPFSEVFIKKTIQASSAHNSSCKYTSNTVSTKSQPVSTDTDETNKKDNRRVTKSKKDNVSVSTEMEITTPPEEDSVVVTATVSESSSSDAETDVTYVPVQVERVQHVQKTKKKSIFRKIFKSVFKAKNKSKKSEPKIDTETESISDSDDYETIYSQKVNTSNNRARAINLVKHKTHSKISNTKQMYRERSPERFRRSPYMEQEYRRHWNERLMFDKQEKMYSSERPFSKNTTPRKPVYYQNYEARTAVVEPRRSYYPRESAQESHKRYFERKDPGNPYFSKVGQNGPLVPRDSSPAEINKGVAKFRPTIHKGKSWLKKHKMGIHCGEQWKKLILEG